MGCIYRYVDLEDNIIKYVGIVWSDNRTLKQRVTQHLLDTWYKNKSWKIEYIEENICTRTDAEYFEAHYISLYRTDKWYNCSKANWGISHYLPNRENDWKIYSIIKCNKSKSRYSENTLLKYKDDVIRILQVLEDDVLIINCTKKSMPKLMSINVTNSCINISENELLRMTNTVYEDINLLDEKRKRTMHERYKLISSVLPFIEDEKMRSFLIEKVSKQMDVSKQTIRHYLCLYLIYQNISILAPKKTERELSQDEKNMCWALDKYYNNINSMETIYALMLKEKYCDASGVLLSKTPSIHQLRYFYKKNYK